MNLTSLEHEINEFSKRLDYIGTELQWLANQGSDELNVFIDQIKRVKSNKVFESKDSRLRISLAGSFSSGKSTLINSILGLKIAPTSSGANTRSVTRFTYSPNNVVEYFLIDSNGEDQHSICANDYETGIQSVHNSTTSYHFLIKAPCDFLDKVVLSDVPGYDPPNLSDLADDGGISKSENLHADIILYVISLQNGTIRESDLSYLENLYANSSERKALLVAFTFADSKPPSKRKMIVDQILDELKRHQFMVDSFFICSKKDLPEFNAAIEDLRSSIRDLKDQKQTSLTTRRRRHFEQAVQEYSHFINCFKDALSNDKMKFLYSPLSKVLPGKGNSLLVRFRLEKRQIIEHIETSLDYLLYSIKETAGTIPYVRVSLKSGIIWDEYNVSKTSCWRYNEYKKKNCENIGLFPSSCETCWVQDFAYQILHICSQWNNSFKDDNRYSLDAGSIVDKYIPIEDYKFDEYDHHSKAIIEAHIKSRSINTQMASEFIVRAEMYFASRKEQILNTMHKDFDEISEYQLRYDRFIKTIHP